MEERQLSKMCQLQSIQECTGYLGVTVPIFGELRINLLNAKRFTPFADGKLGYGIGDAGDRLFGTKTR